VIQPSQAGVHRLVLKSTVDASSSKSWQALAIAQPDQSTLFLDGTDRGILAGPQYNRS
jgi:hypothetical protein